MGNAHGEPPGEVTSFVGRGHELASVRQLLSAGRLVTLTGVGGVGKTRLAHRTACHVRRAFPDGVWFVGLAELPRVEPPLPEAPDVHAVAQLVAATLRLRQRAPQSPVDMLCGYLARRCLLLVLDDCEHLLDACAALVGTLLRACPEVRVLATSREPLAIAGEAIMSVPPLPVPGRGAPASLTELLRCESVALFAERAAAAVPGFQVTAGNAAAVSDICRRLEGLPLAIELAAARLRVLTPRQIVDRLADRFGLLAGGSRGNPDRQQTLRACVDWSFGMCSAAERRLWSRLSVFPDGFDLAAVEGVCAGGELAVEDLLHLTAALVDKSILTREDHRGPVARYRMLVTIRIYGQDRLRETGEYLALRRRHRDWYAGVVARARAEWISDRQAYWLDRLNRERPDLRAVMEFCLTDPAGAQAALRILVTLPSLFWWGSGLFREGRRWLGRALAQTAAPSVLRSRAVLLASRLAVAQGEYEISVRLLGEGEELARQVGAANELAYAAFIRGVTALMRNDLPVAVDTLQRALVMGAVAPERERDQDQRLHTLFTLVAAAGLAGDKEQAVACAEQVLALTEPQGEILHRSNTLWARGLVAWLQGDLRDAAAYELDGLRLKQSCGLDDELGSALCLEVLAWIAASGGEPGQAASLLGTADAMLTDVGMPIGAFRHLVDHHDRCERETRAVLGNAAFARAFRGGRSLSVEEALGYLLGGDELPPPPAPAAGPAPLTRRERQVAELVAQGMTNQQIAKRLVVSTRTAESHVDNIRAKLGFASRTQIAAWAVRHDRDRTG